MATINIKGFELKLDNSEQRTPQNNKIRYSGIRKESTEWHYWFKFINSQKFIEYYYSIT